MNCPNCNRALKMDALYCPHCGYRSAQEAQQAKLDAMLEAVKRRMAGYRRHPLLWAATILFTLAIAALGVYLLTMLLELVWHVESALVLLALIVPAILHLIFMLKAAIGMWKNCVDKNAPSGGAAMIAGTVYDAFMRVFCKVLIGVEIACFVWSVIAAVVLTLNATTYEEMLNYFSPPGFRVSDEMTYMFVLILIYTLLFVLLMILTRVGIKFFKRRAEYVRLYLDGVQKGQYMPYSDAKIGSYIWGALLVCAATLVVCLRAEASDGLRAAVLFSGLDSMGGVLGIDLGRSVYEALAASLDAGTALLFLSGAYYILSAAWMGKLNAQATRMTKAINAEVVALETLEETTDRAMAEAAVEARRAETQAELARLKQQREDEKKAEHEWEMSQERHRALMDEMVKMMMTANGMTPPPDASVPSDKT